MLAVVTPGVSEMCWWLSHRELHVTRDLLQHQVNAVKGEMQEKVEKLSADAIRLDVVVSNAEQMRSAVGFHCYMKSALFLCLCIIFL